MSHHINAKGQFQSDRHPDLPPNKIILSFRDPAARAALLNYAHRTPDRELADDIAHVIENTDWSKEEPATL